VTEFRADIVALARSDLRVASILISVRFDDPAAEQRRLAFVDELLRLTSDLGHALADHARHALSESRGSHSTWDIAAEAEHVYATMVRYEALLHEIGREYRPLVAWSLPEHGSSVDGRHGGLP